MCKEPRTNASSIRYSDTVSKIVNSATGTTFGDKFEFIALDYKENKEKREKYLKDLDRQISERQKKLENIKEELSKYSTIAEKADILQRAILALTDKCNT